jgi:acyl-coenzyme A thioesterase PaaI-like protein
MSFSDDTSVRDLGEGRFDAPIRPGWDIAGNANGGYLLALVGRAMATHCRRPDPVTLTAHYLSPGREGPATVRCETIKEGRRFATVSADMEAGGRGVLRALGAFGSLDDGPGGPERVDASPPELPPVEDCIHSASGEGFAPPFMRHMDLHLHPEDAGFRVGEPSGEARMRGWFRLPGSDRVDPIGLLLGLDAFPPTIFNARLPVGWTPTVELTCHVRARPVPGWLRARFTTRFVTGGFLEEDGELWDEAGRLVAQSRQLALVPRPD